MARRPSNRPYKPVMQTRNERFYTAWVKSSRNHPSRFTAVVGGKADEIVGKADIALVTVNNKFGTAILGGCYIIETREGESDVYEIVG